MAFIWIKTETKKKRLVGNNLNAGNIFGKAASIQLQENFQPLISMHFTKPKSTRQLLKIVENYGAASDQIRRMADMLELEELTPLHIIPQIPICFGLEQHQADCG